jgi:hypothetical protein
VKFPKWELLHDALVQVEWFSSVARPPVPNGAALLQCVSNWSDAIRWAGSEISWWCLNEASNILRLHLNNHHNSEYQEWNHHIQVFAPSINMLMTDKVDMSIPVECNAPRARDWIRSQLTRAYLECVYSPLSNTHLMCDQVEWYLKGHFPCGWLVSAEEEFPDDAITILF